MLKRYPCHATAHAAVRAVRELQAEQGFSGPELEAITVTGTQRMVERHNILEPADLMLAQYSIPSFGSVVAKSAGDQQPDDVLSERLHWQIPDAEILYLGAIPVPPVQRSPALLFRFTLMTDLVWLWVVYRVDSDAVFGAIRRAERLYRTAEEARSAVGQVADRMGAGETRWDQTDEATWVARTTRYVCVVWSIRLSE